MFRPTRQEIVYLLLCGSAVVFGRITQHLARNRWPSWT